MLRIVAIIRILTRMMGRAAGDTRQIDTEQTRHLRELARYQGQVGDNLTVQTTIDMARTQTWTGGG